MTDKEVLGVVLGGGRGGRLWPLTKLRAKPAVPIGGKYRLVDIPLSNCLNSGIHQIAVLTQFNSVSLHRHISQTYNFDLFHDGWVQTLAAEQTRTSVDWYQGTADAVRKQMLEIQSTGAEEVLILAGDHLYRMDYREMITFHREKGAELTVAVKPVSEEDASRFGILKQSDEARITAFIEKPMSSEALAPFAGGNDPDLPYLGSMGIYLFNMDALVDMLDSPHDDFGADVLPAAIESKRTYGYAFNDYWVDVGTITAFFEANLALAQPDPLFSFHDVDFPIFTHPRFLPGSRIYDVQLDHVMLADGCLVEGAEIHHSVIGIRSIIGDDVILEDTVMMGADYYESETSRPQSDAPPIGVGRGSRIQGAIIDKNARIGPSVVIERYPRGIELEEENWMIRDGIVVIPKNAILPEGMRIAPE